ncbi:hypothetical protein RDI58_021367 [Solanum bulbocastanum]|uniref:F-box associated beta-propeller type 3 domain-containing protein n=1 Tax=Solanum bulbocastanum TaxID=147425 RepID=A0AAN8T7J6_SOLBU
MESKTELVIQSGLVWRMKTKLTEIRKEFECESREVGLNKLRKIHSSCVEFLLMSEPGNNGINPATKFCLTILRCPSHCQHKACSAALAFDSSTKQYKVVHVVTDSYGFEIFNVSCADDELHWERVSSPWEDLNDRPFNPVKFHWKNPVSINGRILHWYVDSAEYFITMQVKEEKFSRTYLPERVKEINKTKDYALVELDGFLSFINCDSEKSMNVWILEDFRRKVWSKKHTIVAELTNYICPYISSRQDEKNAKILEPCCWCCFSILHLCMRAIRMGDEIDDIEFARQMLSLQVNKYEENKNRGMKQKQVVEKSHNIIPLSDFEEKIIFNILLKIPPRYIHKNAIPVCKTWKEIFSRTSFIEQNFNESKSDLLIQSGYVRHMKTKLIEIGKDLECESRDLGLNKTRKIHSSCDGFILMSEPDEFYFGKLQVINPATKFCITIPRCPSRCQHGTCSAV